jgi:hypothetical protein
MASPGNVIQSRPVEDTNDASFAACFNHDPTEAGVTAVSPAWARCRCKACRRHWRRRRGPTDPIEGGTADTIRQDPGDLDTSPSAHFPTTPWADSDRRPGPDVGRRFGRKAAGCYHPDPPCPPASARAGVGLKIRGRLQR